MAQSTTKRRPQRRTARELADRARQAQEAIASENDDTTLADAERVLAAVDGASPVDGESAESPAPTTPPAERPSSSGDDASEEVGSSQPVEEADVAAAMPDDKTADKTADKTDDKTADKVAAASPRERPTPAVDSSPASDVRPAAPAEAVYPTGVDVTPELHEKVMAVTRRRRPGVGASLLQTEVVLAAFEEVHHRIPDLVAQHNAGPQVESPLFGQRTKHVGAAPKKVVRLQFRPTYAQYGVLMELAKEHDVPLALLTRLVLKAYFETLGRTNSGE